MSIGPRAAQHLRFSSGLIIAAGIIVSFSGCAFFTNREPSTTDSWQSQANEVQKNLVTPTTPPPVIVEILPLNQTCDAIMPVEALYDFNPNFAKIDPYTPEQGSAGATAIAMGGVACSFKNLSSGVIIDLAVSKLTDAEINKLTNNLKDSRRATSDFQNLGVNSAFFQSSKSVGDLQLVKGNYWVAVRSTLFYEPQDALTFVRNALHALGA